VLVTPSDSSGGLPQFVISEFEQYLDCGRLEASCLLLECRSCGYSQLVAFTGRLRRLATPRDARKRSRPVSLDSDLNFTESEELIEKGTLARLLTMAEFQAGRLVAAGHSDAQVASIRETSTRTVSWPRCSTGSVCVRGSSLLRGWPG
jgi:hypothetical protein